jgi:hypothetical protein
LSEHKFWFGYFQKQKVPEPRHYLLQIEQDREVKDQVVEQPIDRSIEFLQQL